MSVFSLQKNETMLEHKNDGIVHIFSTFNNTIIALTTKTGKTISTASGGTSGFKGSKRSTAYAAQVTADSIAKKCNLLNIKTVIVYIKGIGDGRDMAIRAFTNNAIKISAIIDTTPLPHNGCRAPKARRI
jgi:small subunit ribosomal protein S11